MGAIEVKSFFSAAIGTLKYSRPTSKPNEHIPYYIVSFIKFDALYCVLMCANVVD